MLTYCCAVFTFNFKSLILVVAIFLFYIEIQCEQFFQGIGKHFRFGRQEDAHEFLRYVVEGIQKSEYAGKPKYFVLLKFTSGTKR